MARHRLRDARFRHGSASRHTFLCALPRRPTFHRIVSEAKRAVACSFPKAMSEKPSFFSELRRRSVYKVTVAYAVAGWLVIQIATQVFPFWEIPNWVVRLVIALVALGFPIAAVSAWAFDITPQGIRRTEIADALPPSEHRQHAWIYVVLICGAVSAA